MFVPLSLPLLLPNAKKTVSCNGWNGEHGFLEIVRKEKNDFVGGFERISGLAERSKGKKASLPR